eukprot:scaffold42241_cov250-Skeletonema_dohrnii-CCMP3373.AAC.1
MQRLILTQLSRSKRDNRICVEAIVKAEAESECHLMCDGRFTHGSGKIEVPSRWKTEAAVLSFIAGAADLRQIFGAAEDLSTQNHFYGTQTVRPKNCSQRFSVQRYFAYLLKKRYSYVEIAKTTRSSLWNRESWIWSWRKGVDERAPTKRKLFKLHLEHKDWGG